MVRPLSMARPSDCAEAGKAKPTAIIPRAANSPTGEIEKRFFMARVSLKFLFIACLAWHFGDEPLLNGGEALNRKVKCL